MSRRAVVALAISVVCAGCSQGEINQPTVTTVAVIPGASTIPPAPRPIVEQIPAAIAAVEAFYGAPQDYFEVSATLQQVSLIVAVDDGTLAEQAFFVEGELVEPAPIGEAEGTTFTADMVDFDPDTIFDRLSEELDDPVLIDFALTGRTNAVVYDATVASEEGGVLLVLLDSHGNVLGVQTE